MRLLCLFAALLLTAAACTNPPPEATASSEPTPADTMKQVALDAPFTVEMDERVELADTGVELRFDAIEQDSRCPANVTCVWEGEATARFTLLEDGRPPMPFKITLPGLITEVQDMERYQFIQADRFSIAFLLLQPYPESQTESDADDEQAMPMTATLEVRRTMR